MKYKLLALCFVSLLGITACSPEGSSSISSETSQSEGGQSSEGDTSNPISENVSHEEISQEGQTSELVSEESSEATSEASSSQEEKPVLPAIDHVQVFAPKNYTHIWAWTSSKNLFSAWPGTTLNTYADNNAWKTYVFKDYKKINVIFSEGGSNQTADLSINTPGYYWFTDGELKSSNVDPYDGGIDEGIDEGSDYHFDGDLHEPEYDPTVTHAANALALPAVKNFSGTVVNKYTGTRTDFRDESIYFTITTRFYDGDKSNNARCWDGRNNSNADPAWRGDFKGLIEKMDYIKAQGFTAIWITPVVKNSSGYDYHGYHAINFKEVDPRYLSTDVSFQSVINEAHKRDMKIILDVVFNHTCNFGEENMFPMFYFDSAHSTSIEAMIQNDKTLLPSNYATMPGGQQYNSRIDAMKGSKDVNKIYHHEKNMSYEQYIEQTGQMAGDCVDLNTENPAVANYLVGAYGEFIRMGVDAFRIDTMKHISRLTFNNYIWPGLYEIAKKCGNTNFYMFGEVCTRVREVWNHGQACDSAPFYTWKESKNYAWGDRATNEKSTLANWNDNANTNQPTSNNAYLNSGYSYHTPDHSKSSGCGVIDFPMHWNFQYARDAYNVAVGNDKYYNDATYNVVYVDSHDYGPDGIEKVRYNMGTNAWKENLSLMFTFRGIPCVYYGSEIEFQKGKTIDEGPNIPLANSGRAYFGDHIEGSVNVTGFGKYNSASGAMATTLNSTLSKHIQKLAAIRLQVPALRRGQYASVGDLAFVRRYNDSFACVAISGGATFKNIPNGTYKDLYNNKTVTVTNGTLSASVSGQGNVAIFVKQ